VCPGLLGIELLQLLFLKFPAVSREISIKILKLLKKRMETTPNPFLHLLVSLGKLNGHLVVQSEERVVVLLVQ